jgi:hypothetical protein
MKFPTIATLFLAGAVFTCQAYNANDTTQTISSDGSYLDTSLAVAYVQSKAQDGWVLTVGAPGGSYAWNNALVINIPHVFTIRGADTNNRPTITVTCPSAPGIILDCVSNKTVTLRDFIFNEWQTANCLINVVGNGVDCFRLTNLTFNHNAGNGACAWIGDNSYPATGDGPYGLIDHCEISSSINGGYGFYVRDTFHSWLRPMTLGTRQAVYVENCSFHAASCNTGSPAIDGDNGARFVVRYCSLTNFSLASHGAEALPTNSVLQWEVMHNIWTMTDGQGLAFAFLARGGTGVMFSNTFTATGSGFYNTAFNMVYYRALAGGPDNPVPGAPNRFYPADYLGTQQPGCGVMIGTNSDPNFPSMPWASVPAYYWGSKISAPMFFAEAGGNPTNFVRLGRDFFMNTPAPGYSEYIYPHPLDTGGGGIGSSGTNTTTGTGAVIPPADLQAHPPGTGN